MNNIKYFEITACTVNPYLSNTKRTQTSVDNDTGMLNVLINVFVFSVLTCVACFSDYVTSKEENTKNTNNLTEMFARLPCFSEKCFVIIIIIIIGLNILTMCVRSLLCVFLCFYLGHLMYYLYTKRTWLALSLRY